MFAGTKKSAALCGHGSSVAANRAAAEKFRSTIPAFVIAPSRRTQPTWVPDLKRAEFHRLQITPQGLLPLDGLKQRFEISLSETPAAFSLDHLEEERRPVLHRTRENL